MPSHDGQSFTIENLWFMQESILKRHPLTALVEVIRNSWQAGANLIAVYPSSSGKITVADNGNGIGLKDWGERFRGLGSSADKPVGRRGSMGMAMKTVAPILNSRNGVSITSIKKGGSAHSGVLLGRTVYKPSEHLVNYGFVKGAHRQTGRVRAPLLGSLGSTRWKHGTIVELRDTDFGTAARNVRYLNSAFWEFPEDLEIRVFAGQTYTTLLGRLELWQRICGELEEWTVDGGRTTFGFKKKRGVDAYLDQLDTVPVVVTFNGETVPKKSKPMHLGGRSILTRMGVPVGGEDMVFGIEALDYQEGDQMIEVTPLADRSDIEDNWPFETVLERIALSLPSSIEDYVSSNLSKPEDLDTKKVRDAVEKHLSHLGFRGMKFPAKESNPRPNRKRASKRRSKKKSKKRKRGSEQSDDLGSGEPKVKGFPKVEFSTNIQLEGEPFVYDPTAHRVVVNSNYDCYVRAIRICLTARERKKVTEHWVVHLLKGYFEYLDEFGDPSPEAILMDAASWIPPLPKDRLEGLRNKDK